MKNLLFALAIIVSVSVSTACFAAPPPVKPAPEQAQKKERPLPFYGNIGTVDKQAKTIKLGKRTYKVTPETKIVRNGAPATLNDAAPGDEVAGSYRKGAGEYRILVSLRIGPKPGER
jgi:hypothetical protein